MSELKDEDCSIYLEKLEKTEEINNILINNLSFNNDNLDDDYNKIKKEIFFKNKKKIKKTEI